MRLVPALDDRRRTLIPRDAKPGQQPASARLSAAHGEIIRDQPKTCARSV